MPLHPIVIALDSWLASFAQWLQPQQVAYLGLNPPAIFQSTLKRLPLQYLTQVVAEQTGPTLWHKASNPSESGLVPPGQLQCYWQNLKTLDTQSVHAISLDEALAINALPCEWLWVDRLPALAILRGAPIALSHATVVVVRVVISAANAPADADLAAVQAYMQQQGFVLAGVQPERNPALGTALFFKDYANQVLVEARAKAEALSECDAIATERDRLVASRHSFASEKQQLIAERDAQAQAAIQSQEEQSKQAAALVRQVQEATQTIAKLKAAETQLQSEIATLTTRHEQRVSESQIQNAEFESRQQLLQQELYKAEVQIELIKDLLLREPAL
jgi:hypothetical protein